MGVRQQGVCVFFAKLRLSYSVEDEKILMYYPSIPKHDSTRRSVDGQRIHLYPRSLVVSQDDDRRSSSSQDTIFFKKTSQGAVLDATVDDASRRPRILNRALFFCLFFKFRRRCVDHSANCVPQNLFSLVCCTRITYVRKSHRGGYLLHIYTEHY